MKYNFDEVIDRKGTYCTQWDFIQDRFGKKDILPFSISDTGFKVPTPIITKLKEVVDHQIFGYTRWNHEEYRTSIVDFFKRHYKAVIEPSSIIYSPSVMYSISLLLRILTRKGDGVLTFTPMYDSFYKVIKENQREVLQSILLYTNGHYEIDFGDMEKKLKKVSVFLLCSPHNPTGRVWSKEELSTIVTLCKKYQVSIISDEIHGDIILTNQRFISMASFVEEYKEIYIVSSASKTMNTPGLIGSYASIPCKEVYEQFLNHSRYKDFVSSASILGMHATMVGYTKCDEYIDQLVEYIRGNMVLVKEFIDTYLADVHLDVPEATYLAWIDIRDVPFTMEEIQYALVHVGGIGIMSGEVYGDANYLRMNLGCPRMKVIEGMRRFKVAMEYLYSANVNNG